MNNERRSCDIMILNINISKNNGDTGTVHDVKSSGHHSEKWFFMFFVNREKCDIFLFCLLILKKAE